MKKILNKKNICYLLFCFGMALLLCMLSSINPFFQRYDFIDRWVYQYNAVAMNKGMLPYVDFFDHKGIIVYVINLIGIIIDKKYGIWIMEFIFMFFSILISKKILDLFDNKNSRKIFVLFLVISFLSKCFEGGNLVEEYYLPFALMSEYIFCKYLLNNKIKNYEIILLGACFSFVCFLKINMIGLWGAFVLVILIKLIKERKYRELFKYIGLFVVGISIVLLPIFIYFISNGILDDFFDSYIIFNFKYSSGNMGDKIDVFIYFIKIRMLLIALILNILFLIIKNNFNKNILVANLISLIVNLISASLSGRSYMHYIIIILPSLLIPYMLLVKYPFRNILNNYGVVILVFIFLVIPNVYSYWYFYNDLYKFDNSDVFEILLYIEENTSEEDKISILGNKNVYYVLSNRESVSRYSYQVPLVKYDENILFEYLNDIEENKPKLVYVTDDSIYVDSFLISLGYVETIDNMFILN